MKWEHGGGESIDLVAPQGKAGANRSMRRLTVMSWLAGLEFRFVDRGQERVIKPTSGRPVHTVAKAIVINVGKGDLAFVRRADDLAPVRELRHFLGDPYA